jgi:hypothetical protein
MMNASKRVSEFAPYLAGLRIRLCESLLLIAVRGLSMERSQALWRIQFRLAHARAAQMPNDCFLKALPFSARKSNTRICASTAWEKVSF